MKQLTTLIESIIDTESLPVFLRKQREAKGLTQVELAELAGISKTAYRRYETGKLSPKLVVIEWILEALGYSTAIVVCKSKGR